MAFLLPLLMLQLTAASASGRFVTPPLCRIALSQLPEGGAPRAIHSRIDFALIPTEKDQAFDPFRGATLSIESIRANHGFGVNQQQIFDSLRVFINDTTGRKPLPAIAFRNKDGFWPELYVQTHEVPWVRVNSFQLNDLMITAIRPLKVNGITGTWQLQVSANGGTRAYRAVVLKGGYREVDLDRDGNVLHEDRVTTRDIPGVSLRPVRPAPEGRTSQRPPRQDPTILDPNWGSWPRPGSQSMLNRLRHSPTVEFIIEGIRSILKPEGTGEEERK